MHIKCDMDIISLRPSLHMAHHGTYKISRRDEDLTIKGCREVMNERRELLVVNMMRIPQIGDMWISIIHNGDSGAIMFYAILP